MKTVRYVHWRDGEMWMGYLEDYPDYMTQGETLEELQENLKDLYEEFTSGNIPGIRKVSELRIA
jgi:predicted RNase H-like HicB family nuclease